MRHQVEQHPQEVQSPLGQLPCHLTGASWQLVSAQAAGLHSRWLHLLTNLYLYVSLFNKPTGPEATEEQSSYLRPPQRELPYPHTSDRETVSLLQKTEVHTVASVCLLEVLPFPRALPCTGKVWASRQQCPPQGVGSYESWSRARQPVRATRSPTGSSSPSWTARSVQDF